MLDKRPGDEKRIGDDIIRCPFNGSVSIAKRDIVDLITVFAMAVERNGTLKTFQDNIGNMKIVFSQGEMKVEMV